MRLRARILSSLGRRILLRAAGEHGFNLSRLPDRALMPLRRDGLDPVPELKSLREREPICRLRLPLGFNAWLVTGYAEAKAVLGKTEGISTEFTTLVDGIGLAQPNPGGLGLTDPPVHTRRRSLLTPEFTRRRLARLAPRITSIVAEHLDLMERADEPVDLWRSFALPIPTLTICELLGVPYEDRAGIQRLSQARFDLFEGPGASLGAISQSMSAMLDVVNKQRTCPDDGLIGMLIKEHGDQIDDHELAGLADGVLTGGIDPPASTLALGAMILAQNPQHVRLIRDDHAAIGPFVEELLRYLSVAQVAFPRFATQDMRIGGVQVAAGDVMLCSLSGANRDLALGESVERFDPTRKPTSHLAFGHGIHRCIGAELARMQLRTALPALIYRFPRLRLAVEPGQIPFLKASAVYGVDSLPVLLNQRQEHSTPDAAAAGEAAGGEQ
ncbi:cytochrome P450 [Nonomuraea sp. NPDC059023]|uniref:cytochrome P450 n=1 Tax=unclassified Nonomuraea TaxID=2593643 RepID=UPI00368713C6